MTARQWYCNITGSPVGTDDITIGVAPCPCQVCRAATEIDRLQHIVRLACDSLRIVGTPYSLAVAEALDPQQRVLA